MEKDKNHIKKAFTLSEVLLVILIIGIVAILVLPMIKEHIDTREFEMARRKMAYTFQQAMASIVTNDDLRGASSAEDFVENYLKKQIPMMKTCSSENLRECGLETKENGIMNYEETKRTMPTQKNQLTPYGSKLDTNYGFVMSNGYSVNLFYNPNCKTWETAAYVDRNSMNSVCVNVVYDMNGLKGPNQVGKDIGTITVVDPIQPAVASLDIFQVGNNAYRYPNCEGGRFPTESEAAAYIQNMSLYSPSITSSCRAKTTTVNAEGLPLILICNGAVRFEESRNALCLKNNR